jgi:tetratricopeptide (TPR) repeat protein
LEIREANFQPATNYDALHAMDYMVFGYLQMAQDPAAATVAAEAAKIQKVNVENLPAAYALVAIPARYAIERNDWQQASALKLSPSELDWSKFPQAESVLVFARALGAARKGDVAAANRDLQRLTALKQGLIQTGNKYWADQTNFQIKAVQAWIARAEARYDHALALMREAADGEDATDKHPVTPGNVIISRDLLGEMLIELGRPGEALREFEQSLQREPRRFRALFGAAHAAELSGQRETARSYYLKLSALMPAEGSMRSEVMHARRFLNDLKMQQRR